MSPDDLDEYRGRLMAALRYCGHNPDERSGISWLSSQLEVSYQAVAKVFAGTTKALSAANNAKAAKITGLSPDWLALGPQQGGPMLGVFPISPDLRRALSAVSAAAAGMQKTLPVACWGWSPYQRTPNKSNLCLM